MKAVRSEILTTLRHSRAPALARGRGEAIPKYEEIASPDLLSRSQRTTVLEASFILSNRYNRNTPQAWGIDNKTEKINLPL